MRVITASVIIAAVSAGSARHPPSQHEFLSRIYDVGRQSGAGTGVIRVDTFDGADPTGQSDSTLALQHAVDAAYARIAQGSLIGGSPDHGGATVHLGGGEFLVSKAIWFGKGGNVRLCCGTIRASPSFPAADHVLRAQNGEDLTVDNLMIDCNHTGGGLHLHNFLRAHLKQIYVFHFASTGILVEQGHETHISDSFLGEYNWDETQLPKTLTGTAIKIDGQDDWISDVVVFSGLFGVVMTGGAAVVTNTHIYNGGEASLVVSAESVRVLSSYFDFNPVVLVSPVAAQVSNSFFLGGVGLEIRSSGPGSFVSGLQVTGNQFMLGVPQTPGPWPSIRVNESMGAFTAVNDTFIKDNAFPPQTYGSFVGQSMTRQGTVVHRALRQEQSLWSFDLCNELAFPKLGLEHVYHDVILHNGGFVQSAIRTPRGCTVEVELSEAADATVFVTAIQGLGSGMLSSPKQAIFA